MESNVVSGFSVEVVQLWKGQALDAELVSLDRPRRIAVGEVGRFLLPLGESFDLVVVEDGRAVASVPARATALVCEGESSREIGLESADRSFVIGASSTIEIALDDMTFVVRPVVKEKEKFAAPLFDSTGARWMGLALAFHVAILATFFFMPPDAAALSSDLTGDQMRYIQVHIDAPEIAPPPIVPTAGGDANSGTSSAPSSSSSGGSTPTPAVSGGPGREHVRAPRTVQAPLTAQAVSELGNFEMLARAFASDEGELSPFTSGSPELTEGPGGPGRALVPGGIGDEGPGGLHMTAGVGTCTHEPCGVGTIDQGGLDTHGGPMTGEPPLRSGPPAEHGPTIRLVCTANSTDPDCQTHGGLTRDQIRTIIARHRPEVRYCYEQALVGRPGLEGRVTVGFQIAQDGHVVNSTASGMSGVDTCVAQATSRWHFPSSSMPTVVTYPFVLESTSGQ